MFPSETGRFQNHRNMIRDKFVPLFARLENWHERDPSVNAQAPAYFNWRPLRHFTISLWIDANLPRKTIQTFAGHRALPSRWTAMGTCSKPPVRRMPWTQLPLHLPLPPPRKVPSQMGHKKIYLETRARRPGLWAGDAE